MRKKLLQVILILLLIGLAGVIAADVYITQQITHSLSILHTQGADIGNLAEQWDAMAANRWMDAVGSVAVYGLILAVVWKIGPQKQQRKRVSQEDALKIAAEIDAQNRMTGAYVGPSEEVTEETVVTELEIPVMKQAVYEDHHVRVEWYPVPHADGYSVWRKAGSQRWVRIARLRGEDCFYNDYNLDGNIRYAYAVKAFAFVDGSQIVSKKDSLGVDVYVAEGNIPDVPRISKTLDADGRECMIWTKVENAKVYRILRREENGEWTFLTRVSRAAPRVFQDAEAEPGKTYFYSVSAHRLFDSHVVSSDFDEDGIELKA